ncbi:MAG: RNA pyrophosphohydrolase [Alphaproteobacteria bacterium]|nr:RNA pyrophosphohydrolase [Alphaproteobacteria bacterium]MCD8526047.1 RNA pyrophosphohydrolase [Alphaproteobacteria bacterium]MCD8570597.1 RNA pyrophosphohydrolase [Alphaproteobacteria bacterium]
MSALYRPCVGLTIFNPDGKVFVGERIDSPGGDWQMPQGGIDPGESVEDALWRELYEEVGIDNNKAEVIRIASQTIRYDLPEHLQKKLWGGKYAGQEQTWVALRFTGADSDINLTAHNPPEFQAWQWVSLHKTPDLIIPFKRETYNKVVALFEDIS